MVEVNPCIQCSTCCWNALARKSAVRVLLEEREPINQALKQAGLSVLVDEQGWFARFKLTRRRKTKLYYYEKVCPVRDKKNNCRLHASGVKPLVCKIYPLGVYPFYDEKYSLFARDGKQPVGFLIGIDANCNEICLARERGIIQVTPCNDGEFQYSISAHELGISGYGNNITTLYVNCKNVQTLPNAQIPLVTPSMLIPKNFGCRTTITV